MQLLYKYFESSKVREYSYLIFILILIFTDPQNNFRILLASGLNLVIIIISVGFTRRPLYFEPLPLRAPIVGIIVSNFLFGIVVSSANWLNFLPILFFGLLFLAAFMLIFYGALTFRGYQYEFRIPRIAYYAALFSLPTIFFIALLNMVSIKERRIEKMNVVQRYETNGKGPRNHLVLTHGNGSENLYLSVSKAVYLRTRQGEKAHVEYATGLFGAVTIDIH